jgi:glycosyltransferase involved in cell wall biosynthesis
MINNLPNKHEHEYKFVCFTSDDPKDLFPEIEENISTHFLPFKNMKPTFLKILFYQVYTLLYSIFMDRKRVKISLGVSNFNCDINIIHFVHNQWNEHYFRVLKPKGIKLIYKKFFFAYLDICEKILFKIISPKTITVSTFLKKYIEKKFSYDPEKIHSIHSGFDLRRFQNSKKDPNSILSTLTLENSTASQVDIHRPICLFVGAFERKGLTTLLKHWNQSQNNAQLIIIGKPEGKLDITFSDYKNIIYIPYTKNINLYYEIADYFFFPTIYEPFGMVLIEATIKGLKIISTSKNVGASEVLQGLEDVQFVNDTQSFKLPKEFKKISNEKRDELIRNRIQHLKKYNWQNISKIYSTYLK